MSVTIVQAARASAPYPWAEFMRWAITQGLTSEEYETMLLNGVEPAASLINGVVQADPYPGLPTLEGATLDLEPSTRFIHSEGGHK